MAPYKPTSPPGDELSPETPERTFARNEPSKLPRKLVSILVSLFLGMGFVGSYVIALLIEDRQISARKS